MFVLTTGEAVRFVAVTLTLSVHEVDAIPAGAAARLPPLRPTKVSPGVPPRTVPEQVVTRFAGLAMVSAEGATGRLSVKVIGAIAVLLKLLTVMVSVEVPPLKIEVGAKALVTLALVCTRMVFEKARLVTPWDEVRLPAATEFVALALNGLAGVAVVTDTLTVHELLALIVPPLSPTDVPPGVPVGVPAGQVVVRLAGLAISSCAGSASLKLTPVRATPLPLGRVMVKTLVPPPWILFGENALLPATGASATTVRVAWALCVLVPCEDAAAPAGITLTYDPAVAETTLTVNEQMPEPVPAAGIVAPPRLAEVPPGVAVTTPPAQVVEAPEGVAMTSPDGRLSVIEVPVAGVAAALSKSMVSTETCPAEAEIGLKLLLTPIAACADALSSPATTRRRAKLRAAGFLRGPGSGLPGAGWNAEIVAGAEFSLKRRCESIPGFFGHAPSGPPEAGLQQESVRTDFPPATVRPHSAPLGASGHPAGVAHIMPYSGRLYTSRQLGGLNARPAGQADCPLAQFRADKRMTHGPGGAARHACAAFGGCWRWPGSLSKPSTGIEGRRCATMLPPLCINAPGPTPCRFTNSNAPVANTASKSSRRFPTPIRPTVRSAASKECGVG